MSPAMEYVVRRLATSDFLFWSATKLARGRMIGTLLATDPQLVTQAAASERGRANRILDEILPVSLRSRGMLNDAKLAGNPALVDFSNVSVPTLVISVEDDRFGTAATAREIAAAVPGAKLVMHPTGGHIWIGHYAALWREVIEFVRTVPIVDGPSQLSPAPCTTEQILAVLPRIGILNEGHSCVRLDGSALNRHSSSF